MTGAQRTQARYNAPRSGHEADAAGERAPDHGAAVEPSRSAKAGAPAPGIRGQALDLGFLKDLLGYQLRRAQVAVFTNFTEVLGAFDVSPGQLGALALIQSNPGVKQTVLGEALGIKRASVVPLLDRLERRGLIVRRTPPKDRRSNALYLTAAGERLLRELQPALARHEHWIATDLSAEEVRALQAMLRRIPR